MVWGKWGWADSCKAGHTIGWGTCLAVARCRAIKASLRPLPPAECDVDGEPYQPLVFYLPLCPEQGPALAEGLRTLPHQQVVFFPPSFHLGGWTVIGFLLCGKICFLLCGKMPEMDKIFRNQATEFFFAIDSSCIICIICIIWSFFCLKKIIILGVIKTPKNFFRHFCAM